MAAITFPFLGETEVLNDTARAELPGYFLHLADGVTHYQAAGSEIGEVVILVHGLSVPYFIWDPTFEALTKAGFRVLRYDLFGRGYSDRPEGRYDHNRFQRQLLQLLDGLAIREPVSLVGLSMGGVVAAGFAAEHPERVNKLVLVDPAGFRLNISPALRFVLIPFLGEILFSLVGNKRLLESIGGDFFSEAYVQKFIERYRPQMRYRGFKRALLSTLRTGVAEDGIEYYRRLGQMELPVLLFWGREDQTVPFRFSETLMDLIPQAEFHPVDGVGHLPHYEKPDVVNPILIEFLRHRWPVRS